MALTAHCTDPDLGHTARTQYRKFEANIPRKGIWPASFPISTFMCLVSDLYIPPIGLPILLQENVWTDPGNTYMYKSLTDT